MTERQLSFATQIATPIPPSFTPTTSVPANEALQVNESVDEEPYTIKCICDYSDDDGNTIYCETCDTWQHIECFYPGRVDDASREDFDHSCADCKPRPLDRRHATERQRHQRSNKTSSDNDKKSKRPPSKSHKKKPKPSDLQLNVDDQNGHKNGHDHHAHSKKSKSHRSNQSISSSKRSPPHNSRSHHPNHPPSPAHTPPDLPNNFQVHSYSDHFLSLFENDDEQRAARCVANSFANLSVTNRMSLWLHDPRKLEEDAGVKDKEDVFQKLIVNVDQLNWPNLRVERKEAIVNGVKLQWRYLVTLENLPKPDRIGELNGLVGFQKEYCDDIENRWHECPHPRPLIFFHPRLPLFIDTRQEGSKCRYVRRSCRANTVLETFIANGFEYHFWLISERPLKAHEQITIAWDFKFPAQVQSRFLHLLNLGDEDGPPADDSEITDEEYQQLTNVIQLVLSDHGGCACDLGSDCAFARFHRNYHYRFHPQPNGTKPKKGRKPKHVSPTSTGHATNSRAASEQQEAYDDDDSRSVSGSIKSKARSRDVTPAHGSVEINGILTEPTDREKRKLAALEDSFRKMEQGQPPRKKKRASDGTSPTATNQQPAKSRQKLLVARASISQPSGPNGNGNRPRQYVDASTSRRQSGSPMGVSPVERSATNALSRRQSNNTPSRRSSLAPKNRVGYTDASTQTEEVGNEWYSRPSKSPKGKRTIVSLSQRLLKNRLKLRKSLESASQEGSTASSPEVQAAVAPPVVMDLDAPPQAEKADSPTNAKVPSNSLPPPTDTPPTVDVTMADAPPVVVTHTFKPPPKPMAKPPPVPKASDLHVQMPPTFTVPNLSGSTPAAITPSSASSTAQSPHGTTQLPAFSPTILTNGVAPSPKKKITLGDYTRNKKNAAAHASNVAKSASGGSPPMAPAVLKPPPADHLKTSTMLEGSAMVDSPEGDKLADPMVVAGTEMQIDSQTGTAKAPTADNAM